MIHVFFSKYFVYAFIWGSFTHNGDGKSLPSCLYPIKYLKNESLLSDFLSDNTILLISTLLILIAFLFF